MVLYIFISLLIIYIIYLKFGQYTEYNKIYLSNVKSLYKSEIYYLFMQLIINSLNNIFKRHQKIFYMKNKNELFCLSFLNNMIKDYVVTHFILHPDDKTIEVNKYVFETFKESVDFLDEQRDLNFVYLVNLTKKEKEYFKSINIPVWE